MTKKDFFIVLIKIFGLYSIISILFSTLPGNIAFVISYIEMTGIIWVIMTALVILGMFYLLLIKANKLSEFLKLEKGFDEERIDFGGLKSSDLVKFAILTIGGFLFAENISPFLSHTLFAFKSSIPRGFDQATNQEILKYNRIEDYVYWASSAFSLFVGFLLVTNYKKLSKYIERKNVE